MTSRNPKLPVTFEVKHVPIKPAFIANSYPTYPTSLGAEPICFNVNPRKTLNSKLVVAGLLVLLLVDPASRYFMLQPVIAFALAPVILAIFFARKSGLASMLVDREGIQICGPRPIDKINWRNIGQIRVSRPFFSIPVFDIRLRPSDGREFDPSHDPDRFDVRLGVYGPGPSSAFFEFLEKARLLAAPQAGRISATKSPRTDEITLRYPRRRMTGWGLAAIGATFAALTPWTHASWVARPLFAGLCLWADYKFCRRLLRPNAMHLGPDGFRIDYRPEIGIVEWRDTKPFTLRAGSRGPAVIGLYFTPDSLRGIRKFSKFYPEDVMLPHFGPGSRAQFVDWLNAYRAQALGIQH